MHTNRTAFNTQDLLVPWHLKEGKRGGEEESLKAGKKGELKDQPKKTSENSCCCSPGLSSVNNPDISPDCDSVSSGSGQDSVFKPSPSNAPQTSTAEPGSSSVPVFHRYYHVFQQGELEELCGQLSGVRVQSSYHDQGNWCVVLEKEMN